MNVNIRYPGHPPTSHIGADVVVIETTEGMFEVRPVPGGGLRVIAMTHISAKLTVEPFASNSIIVRSSK